jgi:radical SAM superfamily enzyme YgiQ (UPF0313 family)
MLVNELNEKLKEIKAREFDILCVNAPATSQNKVELPGDPVLMQYALSLMLNNVKKTKEAIISNSGLEHYSFFPNTSCFNLENNKFDKSDDLLYDLRIWNEKSKMEFQKKLGDHNYKLVLFTTLSQSHPYALEMAKMVKLKNPKTIVIFGSNHQSETIYCQCLQNKLFDQDNIIISKHNTLFQILEQKIDNVVDFVVSGQGEIVIDYIMKSAGNILANGNKLTFNALIKQIAKDKKLIKSLSGNFIIAYIKNNKINFCKSSGKKTSILEMPDPTDFFTLKTINRAIRIYDQGWNRQKSEYGEKDYPTINLISNDKCIMACAFCSEATDGRPLTQINLNATEIINSLKQKLEDNIFDELIIEKDNYDIADVFYFRTLNAVANGAGSLFDDTSTHFSGDFNMMYKYALLIKNAKTICQNKTDSFFERLKDFHYAYQLSVGQILKMEKENPHLIESILEAGGEYLYVGLESMAEEVLSNVHKYAIINDNRFLKKENAIGYALRYIKSKSINGKVTKLGTSVLFGLKGETSQTIDYTIRQVGELIKNGLIDFASPNIYTFHPRSSMALFFQKKYGCEPNYNEKVNVEYPFTYFEEANPRNFSPLISISELSNIVKRTDCEWKTINKNTISHLEVENLTNC